MIGITGGTRAGKFASNESLRPGEDVSVTLVRNDDNPRLGTAPTRPDIKIGGETVARDIQTIDKDTNRIIVPAPDKTGRLAVKVGGTTIGHVQVASGPQDTPNQSPQSRGYAGGSNATSYTDPTTVGESTPTDDPTADTGIPLDQAEETGNPTDSPTTRLDTYVPEASPEGNKDRLNQTIIAVVALVAALIAANRHSWER